MKRISTIGDESYYHCYSMTVHERGLLDAVMWRKALLYQRGGMQPKRTRRDVVAEFPLGGIGPTGDPVMDHLIPDTVNQLAILGGAIVFGGYVFVEAQAQWVAKLLGRKQPDSCYQLGEGEWTLNRRLREKG